jgi:hypothetical protein
MRRHYSADLSSYPSSGYYHLPPRHLLFLVLEQMRSAGRLSKKEGSRTRAVRLSTSLFINIIKCRDGGKKQEDEIADLLSPPLLWQKCFEGLEPLFQQHGHGCESQ